MPSQAPWGRRVLIPANPIRELTKVTLSILHQVGQGFDRTSAPLIRLAPPSLAAKLFRTFSGIALAPIAIAPS